jgi:hypothetical protein
MFAADVFIAIGFPNVSTSKWFFEQKIFSQVDPIFANGPTTCELLSEQPILALQEHLSIERL